jgi:putative hemolysin
MLSGAVRAASVPTALAAQYCVNKGGMAVVREPFFNTNGPQSGWLQLPGFLVFCQFTSPTDGSRISISLETLATDKPSLAALAYYARTPAQPHTGSANPASLYCTQLGGTDTFGGVNASGGGWVNMDATDVVLEACIFPDLSSIDSFGLFYHSANIIRGIDLGTVMRYHPATAADQ